jgi:hypothetical protein
MVTLWELSIKQVCIFASNLRSTTKEVIGLESGLRGNHVTEQEIASLFPLETNDTTEIGFPIRQDGAVSRST